MNAPKLTERFWAKVDKSAPNGCWSWTGAGNQWGYGICTIAQKNYSVHRLAFTVLKGAIPPKGYIDHMCHNRRCVNPDHLQLVTNQQNVENRSGANSNTTSGIRGVFWDKSRKKWVVQAKINYRTYNGGRFDSLAEAEVAAIELRNRLMTNNLVDREASA